MRGAAVVYGLALLLGFGSVAAAQSPGAGRVVGTVKVTEADGTPATGAEVIVYVVGFQEPSASAVTTRTRTHRRPAERS